MNSLHFPSPTFIKRGWVPQEENINFKFVLKCFHGKKGKGNGAENSD